MNRRFFTQISFSAIIAGAFSKAANAQSSINGSFYSALDLGAMTLHLRLEFVSAKEVNLYSIDQGNSKIPASDVKIDGDKLSIEFNNIKAKINGNFANDEINAIFEQGALKQNIIFTRKPVEKPAPKKNYTPITQSKFHELIIQSGAPAMIAGAQNDNKPSLILVEGIRAIDNNVPVNIDDQWHIGSITKSFTALLVAIFVERKKLNWDTKLPDLLGKDYKMDDNYKDVTMLHLLSHRAGLPANLGMLKFLTFKKTNPDPRSERIYFVKTALLMKPIGKPAETFLYSNIGFVIAGHILELINNKSWEDLVRTEIFEKLDLKSAGFGAPGEIGKLTQPVGHNFLPLQKSQKAFYIGKDNTDNPSVLGPAGTIHISASDMLKYTKARATRNNIISAKSWEILETPPFGGNYALGVIKRDDGYIWHNGSNTLWYAEMTYNPTDKKHGFAACNSGDVANVNAPLNEVLFSAIAAV